MLPFAVDAQCVGLPSVTSLGSNKFPVGLCSPVQANVTYAIGFTTQVPAGTLELVYNWGDGSAPESVPLPTGLKTYNASRTHNYPAESDCEYLVTMSLRYRGTVCTSTYQVQKISSWRTDEFNGGNVSLISPATKTDVHVVCEGEDIDVVFEDKTNWNCNSRYQNAAQDLIESPNTESRWQQIIYNTPVAGNKIPGIAVNGVSLTGAGGSDLIQNFQDPRGVFFMSAPVLVDDTRRRQALKITAPGGFGAGFPKSGDVFAVTLRYWNYCNPYDDPEIPGPPADLVNGDHPPVEKKALINVLAPPVALKATDQAVCHGTTPQAFSVTGVTSGNIVNWYRFVPGSDTPGALISSGKATSLAINAHPDWKNNETSGVLKVWATQRTNITSATNCESPKILVTRIIREKLISPPPVAPIPADICNGQSFTIALPSPVTEPAGGSTQYIWSNPPDLTLSSSTTSSASFTANVSDFGSYLFVDRTIIVKRQYTTDPACAVLATYTFRIHRTPAGGNLSGASSVCEGDDTAKIMLTGFTGEITAWEIKKDNGGYSAYTGEVIENSIFTRTLAPGNYAFRARVKNGPCNEVYSNEQNLQISMDPGPPSAGEDQFICSALSSAALNASFSDSGKSLWTYVSSIPAGLPAPSFTSDDPNTTVTIASENAGVYTLRWTVTNGSCSAFDDVIIDFGTNPTEPDAGNDQIICGSSANLSGNLPDKGLGNWTIARGPDGCVGDLCPVAILSPASPTSSVGLKGPSFVYGAYTFRWNISSGGNNCFLKSDEVTITFERPVNLHATDVTGICLDAENPTPIPLKGVIEGSVVSAEWMNVSGKGTVSSSIQTSDASTLTVEAFYQPAMADYISGAPIKVKLRVTPSSAACLPEEKTISIHFERKPVAEAGPDMQNICGNSVELNANSPLYGASGMWTTKQQGVIFDDPTDPKTTIRNLPVGNTQATWTVSSAGAYCPTQASSITLQRVGLPDAVDITISECETQSASTAVVLSSYEDSVTSLPANEREIAWLRMDASSEIPISDPSALQSDVKSGQVYVARIRDLRSNCTSDAKVTVIARPLPAVRNTVISQCETVTGSNMASDIDLSQMNFVSAITSAENVDVSWYSSEADARADRFPIEGPVVVEGQQSFFAKVTYRDAPYCFSIARLDLVVTSQPSVTMIAGRESVCQGVSSSFSNDLPVQVYQVMPIAGAKYYWEIPGDPDTQFKVFGGGGESDFYVLLQFPNVYTGKIRVRAEVNGCSGPVIEKEIAVSASPAKPFIEGNSVVCENTSYVSFNVSPDNFPASAYNWEIRRVSDNTPGGAYIMEGQLTGNILVNFGKEDVIISVRENNAECVSPASTKVIKVTDPPLAKLSIEKEISCFMSEDGVIKTEVAGGSAPYAAFEILQTGQKDPDNDGVFENLPQGSYTVRVMDSNGCFATSDVKVLRQPDPVLIEKIEVPADANGYHVSCRTAEDGSITVRLSGGSPGDYTVTLLKYNSTLSPAILKGKDSVTFTDLAAGTYSVVAEDVKGCASIPSLAFLVSPPELYPGAIGPDQVICSGEDPGIIGELAKAQGGTGYYEYEWQESVTGDVNNDAAWQTLPKETGVTYDPPVIVTTNPQGEQRHYRRIVKSISWFKGDGLVCEIKGKTEKVVITVNAAPQVSFFAGAQTVCAGDALALTLRLDRGKPPIQFDYATSLDTILNQTGAVVTTLIQRDLQQDEIYTLLRVRDGNGCAVEKLPPPVTVRVIKINPDFSITSDGGACDGGEFIFSWQAEAGVDYRWEWGDGTATELAANEIIAGKNRLAHTFKALSSVNKTEYPVKLFARHAGCLERVVERSVFLSPPLKLNILAGDTLLCSGESITFYNNSTGVANARWSYHQRGSAARQAQDIVGNANASFTFHNNSLTNPVIYDVVFEAESNSGCQASYTQPVVVYRSNTAAFEAGPIPAFEMDSVKVPVTNTSEVMDAHQFGYFWNFGEQGSANLPTDKGSFDIIYHSPGSKDISLRVVNLAAQQAGKACESIFREKITIPVSELKASFTATPYASCFPVTIQVQNASTGADAFLWKVFRSETLVTTSNLRYPEFRITEPGIYDIHLTASVSGTGEKVESWLNGLQVFDVPDAAFEIRTDVVYVPDTKMEVVNFSRRANLYEWHFGDGTTSDVFEPLHAYEKDGRYSVILYAGHDHGLVDSDGDQIADLSLVCYDSAREEIVAFPGGDLQIPNAFTPNTSGPNGGRQTNGGFNDVFLPIVKGSTAFHMQIYDRWGSVVFESRDTDTGWDGYDQNNALMPAGVYIYKISVVQSNGETVTRAGDVSLIR